MFDDQRDGVYLHFRVWYLLKVVLVKRIGKQWLGPFTFNNLSIKF